MKRLKREDVHADTLLSSTSALPGIAHFYDLAGISQEDRYTVGRRNVVLCHKGHHFVPKMDIDDRDPYDTWLRDAVGGKTLAEWITIFEDRSLGTRVPYADQVPTRKPLLENRGASDHCAKEQSRRHRHADIMGRIDHMCSRAIFALADKIIPLVKADLGQEPSNNKRRSQKGSGKDEVLVATIFTLKFSKWIVTAQQQLLQEMSSGFNTLPCATCRSESSALCDSQTSGPLAKRAKTNSAQREHTRSELAIRMQSMSPVSTYLPSPIPSRKGSF